MTKSSTDEAVELWLPVSFATGLRLPPRGSGWGWLIVRDEALVVTTTHDADTP